MRCEFCNKKNHLQLTCKWCIKYVCHKCIVPEHHNCTSIDKLKSKCLGDLTIALMSQKTMSEKIVKF